MDYQDKEFVCVQCKVKFTWTVGEQKFMQKLLEDGMVLKINPPKRCPDCRAVKRQEREERELKEGSGRREY